MPVEIVPIGTHQLATDLGAFNALGRLHTSLELHAEAEVEIDCSKLQWFDGHLASPFMTVIKHARLNGNRVRLKGLASNVRLILSKNGMLAEKAEDKYSTTISVTPFKLTEEVEFATYSRDNLAKKQMPNMSPPLKGKFFEALDELFANCALHSNSDVGVIAAGQFYPRSSKLTFAISDGGRGIDGSLKASGIPYSSPEEAIDWAMSSNNTTRQGDIPGGLGLKLLREFVGKNEGRLIVASNGGYWNQSGKSLTKAKLKSPFPGTVVILEINTSDTKRYDLKVKTDPMNIW